MKNPPGAVLAFTDDDCVAPPLWLATITRCFDEQADVALIYGQVLSPTDMTGVEGDGVIPTLLIPQRTRLNQRIGFQVFGMGANFAVRLSVCEQLAGFDQVLGGGSPLHSSH